MESKVFGLLEAIPVLERVLNEFPEIPKEAIITRFRLAIIEQSIKEIEKRQTQNPNRKEV